MAIQVRWFHTFETDALFVSNDFVWLQAIRYGGFYVAVSCGSISLRTTYKAPLTCKPRPTSIVDLLSFRHNGSCPTHPPNGYSSSSSSQEAVASQGPLPSGCAQTCDSLQNHLRIWPLSGSEVLQVSEMLCYVQITMKACGPMLGWVWAWDGVRGECCARSCGLATADRAGAHAEEGPGDIVGGD